MTSDNTALEQEFTVSNRLGLHARVAAQIVKVASSFEAEIWFVKDKTSVNAKNILDVLSLQCPHGCKVRVISRGADAAAALKAVAQLFKSKFGET
ncbi:MAG: HPr family phosphocarrier protein [Thermodesulfobacteriota bacterium]|nr:HPr family phosphocarrier protein [Thermodesulfobacteriota bacterium]